MSVVVKDDPWLGRMIGGEYRIRSLLGQGGFGSVYLADQVGVGRTVVVKVIRKALTEEEAIVRRFEREARIVARLDHPNIVKVFTAGETEDGAHYVVMEYAEGPTLHQEIHRVGRVDEVRAARIGAQISGALAAAHAAGVVHRDLKPANVILTALPGGEDHVRVLDFGIAKLSEQDAGSALTASGAILGTPAYMSPEQVGGGEIDGRSDLYTLGVMLYEMVTGKHPYDADTPVQYIIQHLQQPMTPPQVRSPGLELTDSFLEVLDRACAKDPARRFASAEAMQIALRRAAERLAQITDPATVPAVPAMSTFGDRLTIPEPKIAASSEAYSAPPAPAPNPSPARIILPVMLAMALVLAGAAGAIFYLLAPASDEGKPTPAAAQVSAAAESPPSLNSARPRPASPSAAAPTARPPAAGTAIPAPPSQPSRPQIVPAIVPQQIPPQPPKPPVARPPAPSAVQPPPSVAPSTPTPPTPTPPPTPPEPEEFRFSFNEARGFPLPARSRVRMDAGTLVSTDTPWPLETVAEFLSEEFDHISMTNDYLDDDEPWFGLMFNDGPLTMVRADPEGDGTRINYFINPDHEP